MIQQPDVIPCGMGKGLVRVPCDALIPLQADIADPPAVKAGKRILRPRLRGNTRGGISRAPAGGIRQVSGPLSAPLKIHLAGLCHVPQRPLHAAILRGVRQNQLPAGIGLAAEGFHQLLQIFRLRPVCGHQYAEPGAQALPLPSPALCLQLPVRGRRPHIGRALPLLQPLQDGVPCPADAVALHIIDGLFQIRLIDSAQAHLPGAIPSPPASPARIPARHRPSPSSGGG